VERQLLQLPFGVLAFGDIAATQDNTCHGSLVQEVVRDHFEFAPRSIRVKEAELRRQVCAWMGHSFDQKGLCSFFVVGMHERKR
jgi:hypothetical protein